MAVHGLVWQWWTLIYVRVHSHRSTVDNHVVFFDDFRRNLVILQSARTLVSAHEDGFQSERLQSIADGLGSTTRPENKGFLVERLDKRFYALGEAYHITVVASEHHFVAFVGNSYHVYSTDGICLGTYVVQIADNLFLVRDGHIESFQFGIGVEHFCQVFDGRYLEVDVGSVDTLVLEFLVEVIL